MRMFTRFCEWATIQKLGSVADLLFKFTALVAALAAANFFYFQPDVRLTTTAQAFIDGGELSQEYANANRRVPAVVEEVVRQYNHFNEIDLKKGGNATLGKVKATELCERMPQLVEQVYKGADCTDPRVVLGRGRFYERLLLDLNYREGHLGVTDLKAAVRRLREAEYRRAQCFLENTGSAKAENVHIRISEGFAPRARNASDSAGAAGANDSFFLKAHTSTHRLFETARGDFEADPSLEFDVDWDRADLADSGIISWLVIVLLAAFVLVVINDVVAALRAKREEG